LEAQAGLGDLAEMATACQGLRVIMESDKREIKVLQVIRAVFAEWPQYSFNNFSENFILFWSYRT
jgi:hypothetical protein